MSDDATRQILATLDRLETKVDRLETKVDRLEIRQDTTRGEIMARIDRLQHKVDQTHDDIVVNFGHADLAERIARGAVDDMLTTTEVLRVMQRQILRLETDVGQLKGQP